MHGTTRLKITELNPHLMCILCGGYFIDAATIKECLHSFCKTCIVKYLKTCKYCPICEVLVHKTKPLLNVRLDHTLQDLVYKLVPGLFKDEMHKRREFYESHPDDDKHLVNCEDRGEASVDRRVIYADDDKISLSIEYSYFGQPKDKGKRLASSTGDDSKVKNEDEKIMGEKLDPVVYQKCNVWLSEDDRILNFVDDPFLKVTPDKRYLLCPAAFTVANLKKFLRMKFELEPKYQIVIFHTDEALSDTYTLMDIAYIYSWRRRVPLRLFYTVYELPVRKNLHKRLKTTHDSLQQNGHASSDVNKQVAASESAAKSSNSNSSKDDVSNADASSKVNESEKSTPSAITSRSNGVNQSAESTGNDDANAIKMKSSESASPGELEIDTSRPKSVLAHRDHLKSPRSSATLDRIVENLKNGNANREHSATVEKRGNSDSDAKN